MKIKNVSVVFDGFQALTDVNVKVKRNSIHFFIGPNGAGKTTLLDIICAKTKPTGGNVSFYPMHGEKVRLTGMKEYKIVKEDHLFYYLNKDLSDRSFDSDRCHTLLNRKFSPEFSI